jgi:Mitochondrial carrier protein
VKTRVMQDRTGQYKNVMTAVRLILKTDGPMAFYKGFVPYAARMGPQTIVTLVAFEQYSKVFRWARGVQ